MGAQFSSTEAPKQANWRPEEWLIDAVLEDEPLTFIDVRRAKAQHDEFLQSRTVAQRPLSSPLPLLSPVQPAAPAAAVESIRSLPPLTIASSVAGGRKSWESDNLEVPGKEAVPKADTQPQHPAEKPAECQPIVAATPQQAAPAVVGPPAPQQQAPHVEPWQAVPRPHRPPRYAVAAVA